MEHHSDEQTQFAPMEGPPPGTVLLEKYRVDWMLGVGGYGYVVKAHHLEMGEPVAIKILRDDREADPATLGRFMREAKLVRRLKSEHVARVHDVGKLDNNSPYIIMELLEGEDLGKLLENGPLPLQTAVDYILQTCEAIAEAHSLGIVHRDIKPQNLFLAKLPAKRSVIKVLDFGISKSALGNNDMRLTQTQSILGTPAYMSPEQMRDAKTVDFRTDVWALGTVLYELVEGHLPFLADNFAELVLAVSTQPAQSMFNAPELRSVIDRCLAKDIVDRYQSVAEFASAIAPYGSPDAAREYVSRVHRLLGGTPPPLDPPVFDRELPRFAVPPKRAPQTEFIRGESYESVPAAPTGAMTIEQGRPRRSPWVPLGIIGVVVTAAILIVVLATRGTEKAEQLGQSIDAAAPAIGSGSDIGSVKQGSGSAKPAGSAIVDAGSATAGSGSAKAGSGSAKAGSGSAKIAVNAGSNRIRPNPNTGKGSGSAKTVDPNSIPPRPGICPDGSRVASHRSGSCKAP